LGLGLVGFNLRYRA